MKISICLASYNGDQYIGNQISSILHQLRENDELIIVDDKTAKVIESFQDARIILIRNIVNIGVVKNFEKAINYALGDIIFLSDQDDIWLPSKLQKVLDVFSKYPDVTLVLSDAEIIDADGRLIADSFFKLRGKFVADPFSNFIKNKYHGCTMAFRKEMLGLFLPFPSDISMHDIWIGMVNSIYGRVFYIDEPLIQHRRHSNNTSRGYSGNIDIIQIIKWRVALAKNIVILLLQH